MEFKPNDITDAVAKETVIKFKEYNKGVVVGSKYLSSRNWDDVSAKWSDLMDESKYTVNAIKEKMKEVYAVIRNLPEDKELGDTTIAYRHKTERNKIVTFSYTEMYIFLREALKERKETAQYKRDLAEYEEGVRFLEENESKDSKMDKIRAKVQALGSKLGNDNQESTTTTAAVNTAPASGTN